MKFLHHLLRVQENKRKTEKIQKEPLFVMFCFCVLGYLPIRWWELNLISIAKDEFKHWFRSTFYSLANRFLWLLCLNHLCTYSHVNVMNWIERNMLGLVWTCIALVRFEPYCYYLESYTLILAFLSIIRCMISSFFVWLITWIRRMRTNC